MPTIIDRLAVVLGLDAKQYHEESKKVTQGQKKARDESEKTRKQFESDAKKTVDAFREIRNQVLELAAVFVGFQGLKAFTQDIISTDAAAGRLAQILGVNTETLTAWEGAAKRFGATSEDMDNAFLSLQKINEEIKLTGSSPALQWLSRFGVDLNAFNRMGSVGDVVGQMRLLNKTFSGLNQADQQEFGRHLAFSPMIAQMLGKGAEVDKMVERQKKLNVVTDQQAKLAQELTRRWQDLQDQFISLGRTLLYELAPKIMTLIEQFLRWAATKEHIQELKDGVIWLATTLRDMPWTKIGQEISNVFRVISQGVQAVGGLKNALELLLGTWAAFKIAGIVAGLGQLAKALAAPELLAAATALAGPLGIIAAGVTAAMLVPRVNKDLGYEDLAKGDWMAAAGHLPAGQFLSAFAQYERQKYHPEERVNGNTVVHIGNVSVMVPNGDPTTIGSALAAIPNSSGLIIQNAGGPR